MKTELTIPITREWISLIQFASSLLVSQQKGIEVDWRVFFAQFQALYLLSTRKVWANFYNKLHDEIGHGKTETIKQQVDEAYADSKPSLDQFLENPEQPIHALLKVILVEATKIVETKIIPPPMEVLPEGTALTAKI